VRALHLPATQGVQEDANDKPATVLNLPTPQFKHESTEDDPV